MRTLLLVCLLGSAVSGSAQEPFTLKDAVSIALTKNPSIEASAASIRAAEQRLAQARANYLPKVNYSESYARSNNPVFVFSTLLTQRRFTEQNFAIRALNHPDSVQNFQSLVAVDQLAFDGGMTRHAARSADLGVQLMSQDDRRLRMEIVQGVLRAYYGVLLSAEALQAAQEALRSAEADAQRAESVRDAGMSTDSDVLSIQVHLAAVREQQIRRSFDLDLAKAALNEALGLPLDTPHKLTSGLQPIPLSERELAEFEREALASRPEARQANLAVQLAESQNASARSALLPQVYLRGAFEADRARFVNQGGANWLAAVTLRWQVFNGFENRARVRQTVEETRGARAQQQRTGSSLRLQVRQAYYDLRSAQQRIEVARSAVTQAEESLRIIKNRYQAGLTNVTELLRNETALLEARTRYLGAVHDQRVAAGALELAAGTLSADSSVLD
jgi:outer membrane protein